MSDRNRPNRQNADRPDLGSPNRDGASLDDPNVDYPNADTPIVDDPSYGEERDTPNTDFSNKANPPADVGMERTSDDNDLDPEGSGVDETPLRTPYELMALRDDIARQLGEIVISAQEWAEADGSDEARAIADDLEDVYERLGEPSEDTDRTMGMPHLEGEETES